MDIILCVLMFAFGFFTGIRWMKKEFTHMHQLIENAERDRKKAYDLMILSREPSAPRRKVRRILS